MKHLLLAGILMCSTAAFAEESTSEKVNTELNKAGSKMNKAGRDASEKLCDSTKGKNDPSCIGKKTKNALKNTGDKIHDKSTEIKDKVD
ncbi:MAG: hypothetical protein H7235_00900 [Bdellovibrionaceae bacterium]|nr:hypothetical protein [Pseudobdellovibrionaceae bacterium]